MEQMEAEEIVKQLKYVYISPTFWNWFGQGYTDATNLIPAFRGNFGVTLV